MTQEDTKPQIQVDSDWKAEAQAEKEKLAQEEQKKADSPDSATGEKGQLPEASFTTLISLFASQAIMGLGAVQDPKTGGVVIDLDGARFNIDLLSVIEEKTKGNLTEQEEKELQHLLAELRGRFVQVTQAVAQSAVSAATAPADDSPVNPEIQI